MMRFDRLEPEDVEQAPRNAAESGLSTVTTFTFFRWSAVLGFKSVESAYREKLAGRP